MRDTTALRGLRQTAAQGRTYGLGTLITGVIGSAIIALFVRAPARAPGAPARV